MNVKHPRNIEKFVGKWAELNMRLYVQTTKQCDNDSLTGTERKTKTKAKLDKISQNAYYIYYIVFRLGFVCVRIVDLMPPIESNAGAYMMLCK